MNLSTKERYLLEDLRTHEEICIQKYTNYSSLAQDQELKDLFNSNANIEREHLNTINQLLSTGSSDESARWEASNNSSRCNSLSSKCNNNSSNNATTSKGSFMPQGGTQNYNNLIRIFALICYQQKNTYLELMILQYSNLGSTD